MQEDLAVTITRIERVLFLLLHMFRDQIMSADAFDNEDKLFLAKFYDDRRGRGY